MRIGKTIVFLAACCAGGTALAQDNPVQSPGLTVPWANQTPWPFGPANSNSTTNQVKEKKQVIEKRSVPKSTGAAQQSSEDVKHIDWIEAQRQVGQARAHASSGILQAEMSFWKNVPSIVSNSPAVSPTAAQPQKPLSEWVVVASDQAPTTKQASTPSPRLLFTGNSSAANSPAPNSLSLQLLRPLTDEHAQTETGESKPPLKVLPMQKVQPKSAATLAPKGNLKTEQMIGPMLDAGALFSNLGTEAPPVGQPTEVVRSTNASLWGPDVYTWQSPTFFHSPLYFEQPNLERYGIGAHRYLQPTASSVHFYSSIALMPYKVLTQHPCERVYTLGYERPGNCAHIQGRPLRGQSRPGEVLKYWDCYSGY